MTTFFGAAEARDRIVTVREAGSTAVTAPRPPLQSLRFVLAELHIGVLHQNNGRQQ